MQWLSPLRVVAPRAMHLQHRRLAPCTIWALPLVLTACACAASSLSQLPLTPPTQLQLQEPVPMPVHGSSKSKASAAVDPVRGAVASENKICSNIGTDLLAAGGNAADALIGTLLCVGVIGMYHSGIGGGGFMLVRGRDGSYEAIDFRESAPAAASEHMYQDNEAASKKGGLASGIPGELRGLEYLHAKYASLPWASLFQPAIDLARDGFEVSHDLLQYMQYAISATDGYDFLTHEPAWALDFAPNGTRVGLGDRLTRRRYADTLQAIAEGGADVFYSGAIADATIRAVRRANGTMTLADLAEYKAVSREPVAIDYREKFRVVSIGSPASGAVVLSALKTVEGYEGMGDSQAANLSTHRLDEAIRFAYGERASLGDPAFVEGTEEYEREKMFSAAAAAVRRGKISDEHTLNVSDYNPDGFESIQDHGTSHVVTADSSGMAVSLTSTINLIFGSTLIVPETGVIMNDEMDDFSIPHRKNAFGFPPSPSNYIRPRKRSMSSITPAIVEHLGNHSLFYVVGAAGGSRIITATIQNLWHAMDGGMSAIDALRQPRFHDQLIPNIVAFEWGLNRSSSSFSSTNALHDNPFPPLYDTRDESGIGTGEVPGFDNATVAFMAARGHKVVWIPPGYSSAQAIRLCWNGTFEAAGEPRQMDSGGFAV